MIIDPQSVCAAIKKEDVRDSAVVRANMEQTNF
jgi:hypothetical protein